MDTAPLIDSFGRVHDNLRISVTDRCNIRCFYCMPENGVEFVERREILDFEEIERFARIAVGLGITKLRVTGGEPLVRRDLPVLIRRLAAIPGVRDLALTTNGVLLEALAAPLYEAGLRRLNVHLDTLDRGRFRADRAARRSRQGAGRPRCRAADRLPIHQVERGRGEEPDRARHRAAGALRPRARLRGALHRVHAARCAEPMGPRQGAAGR